MSRFTRALIVSPLADGRTWVLVEPFSYDVGELGSGDTIEVSRGARPICLDSTAVLDRYAQMGQIW